jgi:hypothetical protein
MIAFEINEASGEDYADQINGEARRLRHTIEHLHNLGERLWGLTPWMAAVLFGHYVAGPSMVGGKDQESDMRKLIEQLEDAKARMKAVNAYRLPKRLQAG